MNGGRLCFGSRSNRIYGLDVDCERKSQKLVYYFALRNRVLFTSLKHTGKEQLRSE